MAVPALRGSIYDRDAQILAMSIPTSTAVADDSRSRTRGARQPHSRPCSASPRATFLSKLSEQNGYVVLSTAVSTASTATLDTLHCPASAPCVVGAAQP